VFITRSFERNEIYFQIKFSLNFKSDGATEDVLRFKRKKLRPDDGVFYFPPRFFIHYDYYYYYYYCFTLLFAYQLNCYFFASCIFHLSKVIFVLFVCYYVKKIVLGKKASVAIFIRFICLLPLDSATYLTYVKRN